MPILPLYGHHALRERLRKTVLRGALPSSLLLQGPHGVGKQRLALWLAQLLVCTGSGERPCDACVSCRYARALAHPDVRWFFPRLRLSDGDASVENILADYADAMVEREKAGGIYPPSSGLEGIFVGAIHAVVQLASLAPALGARTVFVLGDAERMVPQEGAEFAANALLKLLEEPRQDTTIILTSSEPGSLLPTIRSRVVSVRVPLLTDADAQHFLEDPVVQAALDAHGVPGKTADRVRAAGGAPGTLFGAAAVGEAAAAAARLLQSAGAEREEQARAVLAMGGAGARGFFTDVLDALAVMLLARQRASLAQGNDRAAISAARAIGMVEEARTHAAGNVNPQLLGAALLRHLKEVGV